MDNISQTLIWIAVAMFVTHVWRRMQELKRVSQELAELIDSVEDQIIGLRAEVDQNVIYCYNEETNEFVCQGNTLVEIRDAFRRRFPNNIAYLSAGDPTVVSQWEKELKELNENRTSV
jgi:hypothetical protein